MADLFSVIEGLEVSKSEIIEAEAFWQQYFSAAHPDIDVREGTAVRDLVLRPGATLLALLNKAVEMYFSQNTIKDIDNDTPSDVLDSIMSNWFVDRQNGTNAVVRARLSFAQRKNVYLPSGASFSTNGTLKYYPAAEVNITENQLYYDPVADEYYFDTEMISEGASADYNVSSASLLYFTNFDSYFLHAEITGLIAAAIPPESNEEFITRAETAISTRNLINRPSIDYRIKDVFPSITKVTSIGMGDPEMQRDLIGVVASTGATVPVHMGGKVDIYVNSPLAQTSVQLTANAFGVVELVGPIWKYTRAAETAGEAEDTMPPGATFTVEPGYSESYEDFGFSIQQRTLLNYGVGNAGKTISYDLHYFQLVEGVQAFLDLEDVRVLSADYMARGYNFYHLNIDVQSYSGVTPDAEVCFAAINAYLQTLEPGQPVVVNDIMTYLSAVNVRQVQAPIGVDYTLYKRDGTVSTGTISDRLIPNDRTAIFILNSVTTGVI